MIDVLDRQVRVEAIGENGEDIRFDANGYLARVLHHEMDHLDGITLVERMVPHTLRHDQYIDQMSLWMEKINTLSGHSGAVNVVVFNNNGDYVATGGADQ
ncbi:Peptide deformylase 1A, chloroplastic/mitochondrial [Entophlyctis luteolus]|nr:Peptide deformylase 1A, chloroplastic/mitochondrial [Entophlyctis luteolus]